MGRPQGSQSLIVTTFRLPFTTHKKVKGDGNDGDAGDGDEVHGNGDDEQEGEAVGRTESRDEWARYNQSIKDAKGFWNINDNINEQIAGPCSEQQRWQMGWLAGHWS